MLLGVRSDCVAGADLYERFAALKSLDYDFAELVLTEEDCNAYSAELVKRANRAVNTALLPILTLSISCVRALGTASEEQLAVMAQRLDNAVRYASQFGAFAILVASKEETTDIASILGVFRRVFLPAAEFAKSRGIALCLEPVGAFPNRALGDLVRALDHPSIRLYYDMGNCINAKEDPVEQAWAYGDVVGAVHIKGIHEYELVDMPLSGILMALSYHGFDRTGVIEIGPKDGTNAHLDEAMEILTAMGYR